MNSLIVILGIAIILILTFIYVVKNCQKILSKIVKYKDNKILNKILVVFYIIFLIGFANYIDNEINILKRNMEWYKISKENDELYEKYDNLILNENKYYKEKISLNYENQKYSEPYIPEGFTYVEGEWNTGFVIQDLNQNQYVWVPCTNKDGLEVPKLERKNWSVRDIISKDLCNNDKYEEFIKSALENGGFYISRYEIGNENGKPVSKNGVENWLNINRKEANKIISSMYNNINCELINGYAYDTTLQWLINDEKIIPNIVDIEKNEKIISGRLQKKNIYDFCDNIMEITSETTYSNVIVRGFPFENTEGSQTDLLNLGYYIEEVGRFSIQEDEKFFTITTKLAFRTIIYK